VVGLSATHMKGLIKRLKRQIEGLRTFEIDYIKNTSARYIKNTSVFYLSTRNSVFGGKIKQNEYVFSTAILSHDLKKNTSAFIDFDFCRYPGSCEGFTGSRLKCVAFGNTGVRFHQCEKQIFNLPI
jgi:hypothetical protein